MCIDSNMELEEYSSHPALKLQKRYRAIRRRVREALVSSPGRTRPLLFSCPPLPIDGFCVFKILHVCSITFLKEYSARKSRLFESLTPRPPMTAPLKPS